MTLVAGWCLMACALSNGWARSGEPRDSVTPPDSSAQLAEATPSHTSLRTSSRTPRWPVSVQAGIELGRTSARAQGLDSLLYMATASGLATTLSGDVTVSVGRTQWIGQSGISTARGEYGGYARMVAVLFGDGMSHLRGGWMVSGDFTYVGSNNISGVRSGGVSMYYGRPDLLQGGVRVGERWRAGATTPVVTLDLSHLTSFAMRGTDASVLLSLTGTRTWYTGSRLPDDSLLPINAYSVVRERVPATLADLRVRPRVARGTWSAEFEGAVRMGRAATLWDDPIARFSNGTPLLFGAQLVSSDPLSIQRDQHDRVGAVLRATWQMTPVFSVTGEGGRRMSDPFSGVTGMRYVGISMRLGVTRARNAADVYLDGVPKARRSLSIESGVSVLAVTSDPSAARETSDRVSVLRDVVIRGMTGDSAEIAGDFTAWKPVRLDRCVVESDARVRPARSGESIPPVALGWCGRFSMTAGAHHVVVRTDGGEWHPPSGVPVVSDSFDGMVGLLVVL